MAIWIFCVPFQRHGSWRKASKCKKLIKEVELRLKLLQARKNAIIAQTTVDIAQLLQNGYIQKAFHLVEDLYKDKCRASAYELIAEICECFSNNLPCIVEKRDMTLEVNIAVSSLVFAAARCGELPELYKLRSLFREWYADEFERDVNLQPYNLVKSELKNTLCPGSISEELKLELIQEITKDFSVQIYLPGEEEHESCITEEPLLKTEKKLTPCYTSEMPNSVCDEIDVTEDVSSRETTVNLCEIEEKDNVVQSVSFKDWNKRTPFCCDTDSYQPLPQEPSKKIDEANSSKKENGVQHNRTRSLTAFVEGEGTNDNNLELSHVHPKLPSYEDIEAIFKRRQQIEV